MKYTFVLTFLTLLVLATSIPYRDQIALLNSLEVGRNQDPMVWECYGCDQKTRPISSYVIEEPEKDVKAILSVYEEYTVLAFRYTATATNIFQDIVYAVQVQDEHACSGCKVQQAYDNMWNAIRDYTLDDLERASHTKRLIITGISLGGGLSCISYVDIAHSGIFDIVEVVTFGSPRVGNNKWAAWFDTQTPSTRYFITGDPIVALPRCLTLICTYQQTGTPIGCDRDQEICSERLTLFPVESQIKNQIRNVKDQIEQQMNSSSDEDLGDIFDHIEGYKFIKDFELVA